MASQHPIGTQHTSTLHLDGYLKGIRDEFDRLNQELDETRKQRDRYMTKYKSQVKELQELRQTRESNTVTHHDDACEVTDDNPTPISPVSSSSGYYSFFDGEDTTSDRLPNQENIGHFEGEGNQECDKLEERDGSFQNEINVALGTPSPFLQAKISPDNKLGFSVWDVEYNSDSTAVLTLNLMHKLTLEGDRKRVAFSMDGKYLATTSSLGIVSIFDTRTGGKISVMKDLYHDEKSLPAYTCLEFSPDSRYLATGEKDGNVRIWIISQRRVRNTFSHRNIIKALNFSPNGRFIVTCSTDRTVVVWRLRDGSSRVLFEYYFYPRSVQFSLDGRYIASGDVNGNMVIWNVCTGKLVVRWRGHSNLVGSLVFTPDGKSLLSGSWDNRVIQWDVSFLTSLGMANPSVSTMMEISCLNGHTSWITSVAISPDGKWIASGSWDHTVTIWNAHEAILQCVLHSPKVFSVDFSPVGNCLAIGGFTEDVTIWNYVTL